MDGPVRIEGVVPAGHFHLNDRPQQVIPKALYGPYDASTILGLIDDAVPDSNAPSQCSASGTCGQRVAEE